MDKAKYKARFKEGYAVGWDCIDTALAGLYSGIEPRHYLPPGKVHFIAGGADPIDGVSIYDSQKGIPHRHLVSYGMSELYDNEQKAGARFSGWGFEFTCRVAPYFEDKGDPVWVIEIMNNLARYVYKSERRFEENHFLPAKGPIRLNTDTDIVGLAFALDPELGRIETPHGDMAFFAAGRPDQCRAGPAERQPHNRQCRRLAG